MIEALHRDPLRPTPRPRSFVDWRRRQQAAGRLPIIAVAGSRGKTTVVRMLDAIFQRAGLRTALWTNVGVEIGGRRQSGELAPWSRALERLHAGSIDVALQELDWATVHTVGLPTGVYPVVAVTNICVNSDACLVQAETLHAFGAMRQLRAAVGSDGVIVLNGDDFALAEDDRQDAPPRLLVGLSVDTPLLRGQLIGGGTAAWVADDRLMVGELDDTCAVGLRSRLRVALDGQFGFQVHNALFAAAIGRSCGVSGTAIAEALAEFAPSPRLMPGSFNVVAIDDATIVVDRPSPSWFLRPALRAIGHLPGRRPLVVVGRMERTPDSDLGEVGRMLGRAARAVILHAEEEWPGRAQMLRQGIAANPVPPVLLHVRSETRALARLLDLMEPGDLGFVLADDATAVLRSLERSRLRANEPAMDAAV